MYIPKITISYFDLIFSPIIEQEYIVDEKNKENVNKMPTNSDNHGAFTAALSEKEMFAQENEKPDEAIMPTKEGVTKTPVTKFEATSRRKNDDLILKETSKCFS